MEYGAYKAWLLVSSTMVVILLQCLQSDAASVQVQDTVGTILNVIRHILYARCLFVRRICIPYKYVSNTCMMN